MSGHCEKHGHYRKDVCVKCIRTLRKADKQMDMYD